jgi:hypothetical protein
MCFATRSIETRGKVGAKRRFNNKARKTQEVSSAQSNSELLA